MPRLEACLIDAYDTILTCDFSILRNELSALAGISPDTWYDEYAPIQALVSDGRMSKAEAFALLDPAVTTVLFGATRPEPVTANLGALAVADRLTPDERDRLAAIGIQSVR